MFNFISPDTLIAADLILDDFAQGGWIEFEGVGRLDSGNVEDRAELIFKLLEATHMTGEDPGIIDCQPLSVGYNAISFLESFSKDFSIHIKFVICESAEYLRIAQWLEAGNYFSIGMVAFSSSDVADSEYFLNKYLGALKAGEANEVAVSVDDGIELLDDFFKYCRNSIIEN